MATRRRRMKSSWIGIGFSHHSVPSLSKTATRSSSGTARAPFAPQTFATNSTIARFAGPSRQLVSPAARTEGACSLVAMASESRVGLHAAAVELVQAALLVERGAGLGDVV